MRVAQTLLEQLPGGVHSALATVIGATCWPAPPSGDAACSQLSPIVGSDDVRMYAKVLVSPDLAAVLVDGPSPDAPLWAQLEAAGWKRGEDAGEIATVEITIGPDGLVITSGGQALLRDDANPTSPDGWWDALRTTRDVSLVVIAEPGRLSLAGSGEDVASSFNRAREAGYTLSALARVRT